MILTLEISGPQAEKLGTANRKVFQVAGGTIGRLSDNDWVLPDGYVSSHHARITYANGVFYIEDMKSANGVFVDSPDKRLVSGQPHALKTGDWIFIEPYEIRTAITIEPSDAAARPSMNPLGGPVSASVPPDPFGLDDLFAQPHVRDRARPIPASHSPLIPTASDSAEVDPLSLLGLGPEPTPAQNVPRAAALGGRSVLADHYHPPELIPADPEPADSPQGALIPDDYDPLMSDYRPARPSPQTPSHDAAQRAPESPGMTSPTSGAGVARSHPAASLHRPSEAPVPSPAQAPRPMSAQLAADRTPEEVGLAAVLASAGLKGVPVTPELAQSFGQILRVVVSGVMDVLQARQRIKDEFRMRMTSFKKADNNPLKFSANVDDALHNLLVKRNAAYLGPVEAFEDAFDDLRNHQMAMLAGVRVAFEAMLAGFDPDRLQEQFDRNLKKSALLSVPSKLRYWDLYRDRVHDMVKDADSSFRELFGDEFAKAYEEQLERLKAQGQPGKR